MAQAFNPNPLSVNGMGVPVAERPVPTEEQVLEDTITFLRNSIYFFGDDPDAADAVQHCRERIAEVERKLSGMQVAANLKACGVSAITPASFAAWAEVQFADLVDAPEFVPAGTCPICGLSMTESPHSESECQDLIQYDEMRFYDAGAELAQARIDYRLGC